MPKQKNLLEELKENEFWCQSEQLHQVSNCSDYCQVHRKQIKGGLYMAGQAQYSVLKYIRERFDLRQVKLLDCNLYPVAKRVVDGTSEDLIVYYNQATSEVESYRDRSSQQPT